MKKLKAYIFGKENIGKSELVKKLHTAEYVCPLDQQYIPTIGAHYSHLIIHTEDNEEEIQIELCDMAGQSRSKLSTNIFSEESNYGLYCIDLSKEISTLHIKEFKKDIKRFQEVNPYAQLILVGTKNDLALPHSLEMVQEQLANIKFQAVVSTSTKTIDGAKELYDILTTESKKKLLPNPGDLHEFFNVISPIIKQRNRCAEDSSLYAALNNLHEQAKELPFNIIEPLGKEVETLLNHLEDPTITDKTASINAFIEHSELLIRGANYTLKSVIISVAITAVITVIAGLIGFGIGFALGLWAGPGAFFTGLATGSACAVAVAAGASAVGLCTLAYTSLIFFRAPPLLQAVEEMAQQAQQDATVLAQPLEPQTQP